MKKRLLKKDNKKRIQKILDQLSNFGYTVTKTRFGSGYFVFSFDANSIAWFWLKEFPEWKFGIWLTAPRYQRKSKDGVTFQIFGENIYAIDKFKPSASTLSEKNLISFCNELDIIYFLLQEAKYKSNSDFELLTEISEKEQQSFIDWREYLIECDESKSKDLEKERINQLIFDRILKKEKEFTSNLYEVRTIDRNAKGNLCIYPRYITNVYISEEAKKISNDDHYRTVIGFYKDICESLSDIEVDEDLWIDEFIFDDISAPILSPKRYKARELRFGRDGDFEKHLEYQWNYYRSYELDDKTQSIIESWYESNYPDTPTVEGFMEAFERLYPGKYNPEYTKRQISRFLQDQKPNDGVHGFYKIKNLNDMLELSRY